MTAVQQVLGNLFSAAIFPLIILCRNPETQSMQPALFLVLFCLLGTGLFYLTFDGQYRRLAHEIDREEKHREVHRKLHEEAQRAHFAAVQKHKLDLINKLNAANEAAKIAAAAATGRRSQCDSTKDMISPRRPRPDS